MFEFCKGIISTFEQFTVHLRIPMIHISVHRPFHPFSSRSWNKNIIFEIPTANLLFPLPTYLHNAHHNPSIQRWIAIDCMHPLLFQHL